MPPVKTLDENKKLIINKGKGKNLVFENHELLNFVEDMEVTSKKNNIFREHAKRTTSLTVGQLTGALLGTLNMVEAELDMDHIYIPFPDFLWGFAFIGPFSYLFWEVRTLILRIRQFLWKHNLIKPTECDYEAMCATLCLEQTQAIHYYARTKEGRRE